MNGKNQGGHSFNSHEKGGHCNGYKLGNPLYFYSASWIYKFRARLCTRLSTETVTLFTLHTSPQCLLRHVSSWKTDGSYPFFFFRKENEVRPISLGLSLLRKRKPDFPLPWICTQTSTYNKEESLYAEDFCMKDDWLPRWVKRFLRTGRILRKVL